MLCGGFSPPALARVAGQGGSGSASRSLWCRGPPEICAGAGAGLGASRLPGPQAAVGSFSEGAFLGKCVWEMRFYPSLYFPKESERPSIIHCQTGCLGSQHARASCSARWSPLLPPRHLLLPSPTGIWAKARKTSGAVAARQEAPPGPRAGGDVPLLLGTREFPANFSGAPVSHG